MTEKIELRFETLDKIIKYISNGLDNSTKTYVECKRCNQTFNETEYENHLSKFDKCGDGMYIKFFPKVHSNYIYIGKRKTLKDLKRIRD